MGELITRDSCDNVTVEQCTPGFFRVIKEGEKIYGEVQVDTVYFDIKYLGDELWMLVQLDNDAYVSSSGSDCAMPADTSGFNPDISTSNRSSACPVKVAVLYTEAAEEAHPDILEIINLATSSTNQAFRSSGIAKHQLDLILVGTQLLTAEQFSEGNLIGADIASIVSNSAIASIRTAMFADLVVVMTAGGYPDGFGAVAAFGDFATSGDSAFAIVEAVSANQPRYTFAHEIGHLFGCRHHNSANCFTLFDNSGLQHAHGYAFEKGCNCVFTAVLGL